MKTKNWLVLVVLLGAVLVMGSGCASFREQTNVSEVSRQTGIYITNPTNGAVTLSGPTYGDKQREKKSQIEWSDPFTWAGDKIGSGFRAVKGLACDVVGSACKNTTVYGSVVVDRPYGYTPPMVYTTYYPLFSTGNCRQNYQPAPRYCPPPRIPHPIYGAGRGPG